MTPRENQDVNRWWMCDPGRLGYRHVNSPTRLLAPRVKQGPTQWRDATYDEAIAVAADALRVAVKGGVLADAGATLEELHVARAGDGPPRAASCASRRSGRRRRRRLPDRQREGRERPRRRDARLDARDGGRRRPRSCSSSAATNVPEGAARRDRRAGRLRDRRERRPRAARGSRSRSPPGPSATASLVNVDGMRPGASAGPAASGPRRPALARRRARRDPARAATAAAGDAARRPRRRAARRCPRAARVRAASRSPPLAGRRAARPGPSPLRPGGRDELARALVTSWPACPPSRRSSACCSKVLARSCSSST